MWPILTAILASWVAALVFAVRYERQRNKTLQGLVDDWKARHDKVRDEANVYYQANVDINVRRQTGQPIFGDRSPAQKAFPAFELGADRVNQMIRDGLAGIQQEEELEPDDAEHLDQIENIIAESIA